MPTQAQFPYAGILIFSKILSKILYKKERMWYNKDRTLVLEAIVLW